MKYNKGEISALDDSSLMPWERGVRQGGNMNITTMSRNLLDFKEVLDELGVPFVLIFGTLLGVIRENAFISYDTDVDVACFNEFSRRDHWKLATIKSKLIDKGFTVISNDRCYLHIDFFIRAGEKIEIWWFDKIDNEWIFGDTVRYPSHYFDNLQGRSFLGTSFKIPERPEEFLELTYGKNWIIPNDKTKNLNLNPTEVKKRQ